MSRTAGVLALALVSACGADNRTTPTPADEFTATEITVTAHATRFDAPDSATPGWHRVRFHQAQGGVGRNLVLFSVTDSIDLESLAALLDTAQRSPEGAIARGGLESPRHPDDTASVLIPFAPGRYVWTSLTRAPNGKRHVTNGMWRSLIVTGDSSAAPKPAATVAVRLVDHAFVSDDTWPSGRIRVEIANAGTQDHILNLMRMKGDQTLTEYLDKPGRSERIGGISRLGPGQVVQLELDLEPGRYVALCLIRDPATGKMHLELGMARIITVEDR